MKVSKIGLISKKLEKINEQFPVQDMLFQTGQVSQFASGIYAYGHIPFLAKTNIKNIISDMLTKYGCAEISLPLLQPESMWEESGRLQKYIDEHVMFRCLTKEGNYCLAPTAEEAVVAFAKERLKSYKQLPVTFFQIGDKFRNELRARGFLLRGKQFEMMDAYSFGRNEDDLVVEYNNMKKAYMEIFEKLGLNVQPVGADSGSIGGNKSEEFMCISSIGEDNVLFDEKSGKAFNSELLDREDGAKYLKDVYGIENVENLKSQKAVELGHIFQLGDKYAKSMNATFIDNNGKSQYFQMGCYGIGVSRTLAMVYENSLVNGDLKSVEICLPLCVAPYVLYIVPKLDDEKCSQKSLNIYNALEERGVKVLYDDRAELSIGAKVKDSKITGTPYVAILGNTLKEDYIEVENNKTGNKMRFSVDEFIEKITQLQKEKINNKYLEDLN